jgi:hypothetical protein
MKLRNASYRLARRLGDLHALEVGRYPQRIFRKTVYKHAARSAGWLCRLLGVGR